MRSGKALFGVLFLILASCGGEKKVSPAVTRVCEDSAGRLRYSLDRDKIKVGDNVQLQLELQYPENSSVSLNSLPEVGKTLPEKNTADNKTAACCFTVVERDDGHAVLDDGISGPAAQLSRTVKLRLEPFLAGDYEIPPLALEIKDANEKSTVLRTEPLKVTVAEAAVASDNDKCLTIKEIADIKTAPSRPAVYFGLAAAAVAALGAFWGWRRYRSRPAENIVPPVPPREKARADLAALLAEKYPERGMFDEFYVGISAIVRSFIEQEFALSAPEQTTEEFLHTLSAPGGKMFFSDAQRQMLAGFLRHCDMVKFAKFSPTLEQTSATVAACEDFIANSPEIAQNPVSPGGNCSSVGITH